jgi:hypothetical protein
MSPLREDTEPLEIADIDLFTFFKLNPEARIMIRKTFKKESDSSTPEYHLALNFKGDLCYVVGNDKKLIAENVPGRRLSPEDLEGVETPESLRLLTSPLEGGEETLNDPIVQRIAETQYRFWKRANQTSKTSTRGSKRY